MLLIYGTAAQYSQEFHPYLNDSSPPDLHPSPKSSANAGSECALNVVRQRFVEIGGWMCSRHNHNLCLILTTVACTDIAGNFDIDKCGQKNVDYIIRFFALLSNINIVVW